MSDDFAILANGDGMVQIDLALGNIVSLDFFGESQTFSPLHTAHWVTRFGTKDSTDLAPIERNLAGDFLCAPFGSYGSPDHPLHGPTANSRWIHKDTGRKIKISLETTVSGAFVEKEVALGSGPFLYQVNRFTGGQGAVPVSTHPMLKMQPGDRICMSPKQLAKTPDEPPVPGHHRLIYPENSTDMQAFPGREGPVELGIYPEEYGNDDLVLLAESPQSDLGWTAILSDKSITVILKDPKSLPITQLWISNGGNKSEPWLGIHINVLGVIDACFPFDSNHPEGITLSPENATEIRHVIGSFPRPQSWDSIEHIEIVDAGLRLTGNDKETMDLPFNSKFFDR